MIQTIPEILATWWNATGVVEPPRWMQPADGYIQIELGDHFTLSFDGEDAAKLLFYLTGEDLFGTQALPSLEEPIAWSKDDATTIQVDGMMLAINNTTKDKLSRCLGDLLKKSLSTPLENVGCLHEGF